MYFQIYQDGVGRGLFGAANALAPREWRWRLRGRNHEVVASGEGYKNKRDCEHAVNLLKGTGLLTPVHYV
ncbi:DUF1508 domain-containing protein [Sphingosinicella sp. BN140058]|uniref:YegP family protein n=1 Tax=Sphingosinicella sp. BN140058 TaxID=1892855 RepID=UPI001012D720|nr:DUF1508 domain-containing protein [Sphingosinicella sp. BN140058]